MALRVCTRCATHLDEGERGGDDRHAVPLGQRQRGVRPGGRGEAAVQPQAGQAQPHQRPLVGQPGPVVLTGEDDEFAGGADPVGAETALLGEQTAPGQVGPAMRRPRRPRQRRQVERGQVASAQAALDEVRPLVDVLRQQRPGQACGLFELPTKTNGVAAAGPPQRLPRRRHGRRVEQRRGGA
jgi:hypothetical protein